MGKTRALIPAAFITTAMEKDEVLRLGCSTYLETHEVSTKEKGFINLINAPTIKCAEQLFNIFQIPVRNGRIFEIGHPTPKKMTALKLGDSNADIILLDSGQKVSQAINYARDAQGLMSMRSDIETIIFRAEAMMRGQSIAMRLTNKISPQDLVIELQASAHRCESLFADLKTNFFRDLCV